MDRLIFTALSGMQASMQNQQVIASNMANAQTTGFRAELMIQTPVTIDGDSLDARAMQQSAVRGADMAAGEIASTGRPLDIAVDGDALIAVQAADGSEAYTRRGDLSISPAGVLVNGEGRPVIGDGGPITLPLGTRATITRDGTITATDPAAPDQPAQELGRIKLASPAGSMVLKGLDGLFRVEGGGTLPTDEEATLLTGSLEQSNVKPTEVLVQMIDAQRLFAIRGKLISTARDCDENSAQLMRLS